MASHDISKFVDGSGDEFNFRDPTKESLANKVTSIRAASSATDTNYPTEKAVRTELDNKAQTFTIKQTDAYKCFLCMTDLTQLYDSTGQQPISQRFNMVGQWSTWRNGAGFESTSVFFMKYHLAYRWNLNSADCFDLRSTIPSGGTAYPAILRDARDQNNVKYYFGFKLNDAWATAFQFVGRLNDIDFNSLVWIDGVGSGGTGQGKNLPDGCELIATPKVLNWTVEHSSTADNVPTTEVACGASDKVLIADYSDGWKLKRLNASLGTVNGANAWAFGASSLCGPRSGIDATPYVQWDFMDGQAFSVGGETYYAYTADPNTTVSVSYNGETVSVSVPSGNNKYTIFVITDAAYLGSASFTGRDRCAVSIDGKTSYRVSIANNYSVNGGYVVAVNIGNNAWGHATSSSSLLAAKAVASNSFSGNNSYTIGYFSAVSGNQSVASGYLSVASGNYSIASGRNSIAAGHFSIASGDFSVTTAQYANAVGAYSVAKNDSAQVLARGGLSGRSYQTVLGRWNEEKSDRVLVIGEGTSSVSRKNILEVDANGEMYLTSQKKKAYREGLTVPVPDGGTGKASVTSGNYVVGAGTSAMVEKTPKEVGSDVLSSLDDKSNASSYANFVDSDFVVGSDHVDASTISASTFVRRTALNLWNYIKSKLTGSDVNIGGNAATAGTADTAKAFDGSFTGTNSIAYALGLKQNLIAWDANADTYNASTNRAATVDSIVKRIAVKPDGFSASVDYTNAVELSIPYSAGPGRVALMCVATTGNGDTVSFQATFVKDSNEKMKFVVGTIMASTGTFVSPVLKFLSSDDSSPAQKVVLYIDANVRCNLSCLVAANDGMSSITVTEVERSTADNYSPLSSWGRLANDSGVVHLDGSETIIGAKEFSRQGQATNFTDSSGAESIVRARTSSNSNNGSCQIDAYAGGGKFGVYARNASGTGKWVACLDNDGVVNLGSSGDAVRIGGTKFVFGASQLGTDSNTFYWV